MAKSQICLSFIIFLYLTSEGSLMRVNAQLQSQGDWCVAKPGTTIEQLLKNLNFACLKIDCQIVSQGGACYTADNLYNTASVAMNLYYQAQGRHYPDCDFSGSAIIAITDPSYGCCVYEWRNLKSYKDSNLLQDKRER